MMRFEKRDPPPDDSPVPGVIPAPIRVVHGEPSEEDERDARRRRKAGRRPLISRARAVWSRRRTDRP
jgi:hypothetical protein